MDPSSSAPSAPRISDADLEMTALSALGVSGCDDVSVNVSTGGPPAPPDLQQHGRSSPAVTTAASGSEGSIDPRDIGASAAFFCPISQELYRDPVLVPTGQTYERKSISMWLTAGNLKCPITGQMMAAPVALVPNVALRHSVEEWCEKNMPQLLDANGHLKPADVSDASISDYETEMLFSDPSLIYSGSAAAAHRYYGGHEGAPSSRRSSRRSRESIGNQRQSKRAPWFLYLITATLVVTFVVELAASGWQFAPISVNPFIGPDSHTLVIMGAKVTPMIVYENQWWRLLSAPFLSAGIIHLLASVSALWIFGRHLERETSPFAVASVFLTCAVGGTLLSANMAPDAVTVGSNGGVFGLLGAAWAEHIINWRLYKDHWVIFLNLVVVTAINALAGLLPFVDNWTNAGGLFLGAALCCAVLLTRRHSRSRAREAAIMAAQAGCGVAVLVYLVAFTLCLVLDLRIAASCSWCRYLTCVPTEWWVCDNVVTDPNACRVTEFRFNATVALGCPGGRTVWVPAPVASDEENFVRLCQQQCGLVEVPDSGLIS